MAFIRSVPNYIKDLMPNAMNANVNVYVFFCCSLTGRAADWGIFHTRGIYHPTQFWVNVFT